MPSIHLSGYKTRSLKARIFLGGTWIEPKILNLDPNSDFAFPNHSRFLRFIEKSKKKKAQTTKKD